MPVGGYWLAVTTIVALYRTSHGVIPLQSFDSFHANLDWREASFLPMRRTLLKSKIHRATVTDAHLHYDGSVTIDKDLIQAASLVPFEQVDIYDVTNGSRLTTYVIEGEAGSGEIRINGAAAHLVHPGDLVIIASYAELEEAEIADHQPKVVLVDQENRIRVQATSVEGVEGS